jgi:hypothetical protein
VPEGASSCASIVVASKEPSRASPGVAASPTGDVASASASGKDVASGSASEPDDSSR